MPSEPLNGFGMTLVTGSDSNRKQSLGRKATMRSAEVPAGIAPAGHTGYPSAVPGEYVPPAGVINSDRGRGATPGEATGRFELSTLEANHDHRRGAHNHASIGSFRSFPIAAEAFP